MTTSAGGLLHRSATREQQGTSECIAHVNPGHSVALRAEAAVSVKKTLSCAAEIGKLIEPECVPRSLCAQTSRTVADPLTKSLSCSVIVAVGVLEVETSSTATAVPSVDMGFDHTCQSFAPELFRSVPGCPNHARLIASASVFVMRSHTASISVALPMSNESVSGLDTMLLAQSRSVNARQCTQRNLG